MLVFVFIVTASFSARASDTSWGNCFLGDVWVLVDNTLSMYDYKTGSIDATVDADSEYQNDPFELAQMIVTNLMDSNHDARAGFAYFPSEPSNLPRNLKTSSFRPRGEKVIKQPYDISKFLTDDLGGIVARIRKASENKPKVTLHPHALVKSKNGTYITRGLELALRGHTRSSKSEHVEHEKYEKVIIIITDGEDVLPLTTRSYSNSLKQQGWNILPVFFGTNKTNQEEEKVRSHLQKISWNRIAESSFVDTVELDQLQEFFGQFTCG